MTSRTAPDPGHQRSASRGQCYLYVLPCAYEDILKLGLSRDPLSRMQALHRRYFDFFDLDRAILVETDKVREARDLELALGRAIKDHSAPAPLIVRREAAGHTEWYRGAHEALARQAQALSEQGYVVHRGLHAWVRRGLLARSEQLHTWSQAVLALIECTDDTALPSAVRDTLDAYVAFGIELEPRLPDALWRRYRPDLAR
ncbi:GIY-YIG nuclease family protein [Lysobacter koreensis]|uniref:GIY-YIG nuclease family protein n=1 Tax=Lysobacter koreensis TaxID=266122 RepID=A0ABW2YR56_9GAMM